MKIHNITIRIILCFILAVTLNSCNISKVQEKIDLETNGFHTSIGAISDNLDLNQQRLSFSFDLSNTSSKSINVKEINLILPTAFEERLLSDDLTILVEKDIEPGAHITIEGELIFDSTGLSKEQIINDLDPKIEAIRIVREETLEIGRN